MSIDLSEFHDVFFEECFEGLDLMESGLLELDQSVDVEDINAIFRAAHSIKGGSASFGFMEISGFTHVMETLLDEMRDGRRHITRDGVDLLLASVDVLRGMVSAAKDGQEVDGSKVEDVKRKLEEMLASGTDDEATAGVEESTERATPEQASCNNENTEVVEQNPTIWQITFRPDAEILCSGNEPIRIFRELALLGDLSVETDASDVPRFEDITPEHCYLSWNLVLKANVSRDEIEEVFSWVADESDLNITEGDDTSSQTTTEPEPIPEAELETEKVTAQPGVESERKIKGQSPEQTVKAFQTPVKKSVSSGAAKDASSIRVSIDKVDELINLVGELVITQSMLSQAGDDLADFDLSRLDKLRDGLTQLERNTRELQESVLQIRMLPISFSFNRFPRLVRDLSSKIGKQVELTMTGEQTEVDKTVLEKINDPLVHLVRNALDHGIETPDVRAAAGKSQTGKLELCAYHEGGDIVIKVIDDGAGLDKQRILSKAIDKGLVTDTDALSDERIYNLIFAPGFSTAEQVSDVSGRGVGMDVVRRNVRDLGGNVTISSNEGAGSTVTIRLPLTLAILDGQLARVGNQTYIVSIVSIVESLLMQPEHISSVNGRSELYRLRDEYIPIIRLNELLGVEEAVTDLQAGLLMIVESDNQRIGLFVDELMGQQQVVIKSLESNFTQIQGVAGATILGDGMVALIIDVPGLVQRYFRNSDQLGTQLRAVS